MTNPGVGIFPYKLHHILAESEAEGTEHVISWLPCGKLFKVHDPQEFSQLIMRKYFRHARFKSFLRQLSMYKFQRIVEGPQRGAYGHPFFVRGQVELSRTINRGEKLPVGVEEEKTIASQTNPRKMTSSCLPLVDILSTSSRHFDFDPICATPFTFSKSLKNIPLLDLKLLNYTISLNSELSTPADVMDEIIMDEIIRTFGTSPSPTHKSWHEEDVDVSDELSFLLK